MKWLYTLIIGEIVIGVMLGYLIYKMPSISIDWSCTNKTVAYGQ